MGCCESREEYENRVAAANAPSTSETSVSKSRRRVKQEVCPSCSNTHTPDVSIPTSSPDYVRCADCRKK